MLHAKAIERRSSLRVAGSYQVQLRDARGRLLGRGRTANISSQGVFVLLPGGRSLADHSSVQVEMDLPGFADKARTTRRVCYKARVARVEAMGQWQGVGLELLEKLA